jgi:ABC-type nitrate/sulfonate/bicarbonate transport system permease component
LRSVAVSRIDIRERVIESRWTYRLIAFLLFAGAWQIFASLAGTFFVPTFAETAIATVRLALDGHTWDAFLLSNQSLVLGFAFSVALGIPIGLAMGRFRGAEQFTDVYVNILIVTPMAALIPLLLMSLGFTLASRVILVTLFAITMVIVNSRAGVRQVDVALLEMARSFGASEWQIWRRVLLPAALPAIMTGVRIGLGRAITGMVIVELLMVSVGIGNLILRFRGVFEYDRLYAVVVLVVIEALVLINLARAFERRATPWVAPAGIRS